MNWKRVTGAVLLVAMVMTTFITVRGCDWNDDDHGSDHRDR